MISVFKITRRSVLVMALILIVSWNIAVWFVTQRYYLDSVRELINQETRFSQERGGDLADSIQRNLKYLDGIPVLLSDLVRVKGVVTRFGAGEAPSPLPLEERRARWTGDPILNDLSRYLQHAKSSLSVDLIYVVNAAGDCVAASNWNTPGNSIGTNFAEREFFRKNKQGKQGMQYAVGKTTRIPGLYFSFPVWIDGKFMGAVVAKTDVPNLSFLINQTDAFVTDANGVIILAHDKRLELLAFPDAPVELMTEQDRQARYLRSPLPVLKIESWNDRNFPGLLRIQGENIPHILAVNALPEYGLNIYVDSELVGIAALHRESVWFTLLLAVLGSVLLAALCGAVLYFQSARRSKVMLWTQANFDALTGLPNRAMFHDRLAQELKKADRTGLALVLMLIDLDHFKEVNDTLGHAMGDLLLKEATRRMVDCVRETDTVARLGGDEFTVVLPQLADAKHAEDVARKIITTLAEPFDLHGHEAAVSASIGIAIYPRDAGNAEKLIKAADQAMYLAKKQGRNRFAYWAAES